MVNAENLIFPTGTIFERGLDEFFQNCYYLIKAPKEIPATTLGSDALSHMFKNCSALTTTPLMYATCLSGNAMNGAFENCSAITSFEFKNVITNFGGNACHYCFNNCANLERMKIETSLSSARPGTWMPNVKATGTFITNNPSAWLSGSGGIPTGWTVQEIDYLTIEALSAGTLTYDSSAAPIFYSKNGGDWERLNGSCMLAANDKVRLKGNNNVYYQGNYGLFGSDVELICKMYGNVMSLIYGDNHYGQTALTENNTFRYLFNGFTALVDAEDVKFPALQLTDSCYRNMFSNNSNLIKGPKKIDATTFNATNECSYMFYNCGGLTAGPELPATALTNYCYSNMFNGCSSLTSVKCLATDINANGCTSRWLRNVSATGTFTKAASMNDWTTGEDGIPSGWTVQDAS